MGELDVYAVFGLTAPQQETAPEDSEGVQEQEVADPADTGVQEQEIADPAEPETVEPEQDKPDQEEPVEKAPLTKEQKAEQARLRREQEKLQAAENARKEERKAMDARLKAFFEKAKIEDPINGGTIQTLEDGEKWLASMQAANIQRNLKQGKLTQEDLQAMIEASPTMQKAREVTEKAEAEAKAIAGEEFTRKREAELANIRKLDPTVQTLTDIIRQPTGRRFMELVEVNGLSYEDAFRLANHDRLQKQAAQVAAAGAKVSSGGKEHLTKTGMRGSGSADVSREQAAAYRLFCPDMTDDQIQKDYGKRVRSV